MKNEAFGSVLGPLTKPAALPPLNAGQPDNNVYDALIRLSVENAFENKLVDDESMAQCCISGLWLLHGYLDQSHRISQQVDSPTGSYWHGIMHRREGDYGNSKYWFRRVGNHVIWEQLAQDSVIFKNSIWDPYRFVDLCEEFAGTGTDMEKSLEEAQMREWELLFAYSYRSISSVR